MKLETAVKEGTQLVDFFTKNIEAVHLASSEDFEALSEIPILICLKFDDGQIYSVLISRDEVVVEDDEMVDFPNLTIKSKIDEWPLFLEYVRQYLDAYESKKSEIAETFRITEAFRTDVEKLDLVVELEVLEGGKTVMSSEIVLNDYEDSGFKRVTIKVDKDTLDDVAHGRTTPVQAVKGLSISGAVFKAAELGQLFLKHRL